ncbi:MAG: S-layer homology domain-containing protein [Bacillota bacterium]
MLQAHDYSANNILGGFLYGIRFVIDAVPANLERVTAALQLDDGETTVKTFDVSVAPSGSTALNFLSSPGDSDISVCYPTDSRTTIGGPTVYDAAAFVDEATGALRLYLAGSGGVFRTDPAAATDLVMMDGMRFAYNDNLVSSGFAFAIGGADEEHLAALVRDNSIKGTSPKYCIYTCTDGVWTKTDQSEFAESDAGQLRDLRGLVIAADDIWLCNRHWDGTSWQANDVTFNSFGKCKGTYFAGSDDGLYRRGENGWRQVADTSGPLTVTSVAENDDGTFAVICGTAAVATRVDVDGFSGSVSSVDSTDVYNPGSVQRFIGFDDEGSLYTIVSGRRYDEGTSGYNGGALYKYVDGAWQYQVVDGFNDPNEDSDPARKLRPDGIRKIMIPHDHVTLFYGEAGAVYAQYGETTIRFEENEGSEVADITRPAGSAVTAPASPTLEGYSFAGWYTKPSCLAKYLYSFGTMPYKDITLYAKWVETGEDALETIRAAALETLETAYGRYDEGEYAPKDWNTLVKAYKTGKKDIAAGESYDAVQTALNTAVAAMSAVEKTTEITVAVTIEKLIVDGTYIMEPRLVTVPSHPMASVVLTDLLKEMYADAMPILNGSGYNPYRITGTETNNFYIAGVYDPSYVPSAAGDSGKNQRGEPFGQSYESFLCEFDGGAQSGWMYCVNNSFPGVGASAWTLNHRDVMRWQYTCVGLGSDIGADNSAWGDGDSVPTANKDNLIWRVAEINGDKQAFFDEAPGNEEAYNTAMNALKRISSTQEEVDAALAGLGGLTLSPSEQFAKFVDTAVQSLQTYGVVENYSAANAALWTQYVNEGVEAIYEAETEEEVTAALDGAKAKIDTLPTLAQECEALIDAIGEVDASDECKARIDAARMFYESLSSFMKFDVGNIAVLEKAEADYAEALRLAKNQAKADEVIALIDAIGEVTADSKDAIDAARSAFDGLTDFQQTLVTNIDVLEAAEAAYDALLNPNDDQAKAGAVIALIDAIGDVTADSKEAIEAARSAYDALTDAQKELVTNAAALEQAEKAFADLADQTKANEVIALIDAIGNVTADSKEAIEAARSAYDALTDSQKALVTNIADLLTAEKAYEALTQQGDDQAKADEVIALIDAIGEVTADSKDDIEAARSAFDALTDAQKELVTNADTLEQAEKAYEALTQQGDDRAKADAVTELIRAIGDVDASAECKERIDAARAAYDALTNAQKELVTNAAALTAAEEAYAALTAPLPFIDIANHWGKDAIIYAHRHQLVDGIGENRFAPDMEITRGMVVTILYRQEGEPAVSRSCAFNDVAEGRYYYDAVIWAQNSGVVKGMSPTVFAPEENITREQLATMIHRYAGYKGIDVSGRSGLADFRDASLISGWAKEAMSWANDAGLILGRSRTELAPRGTATRAEFVTVLMRYLETVAKK